MVANAFWPVAFTYHLFKFIDLERGRQIVIEIKWATIVQAIKMFTFYLFSSIVNDWVVFSVKHRKCQSVYRLLQCDSVKIVLVNRSKRVKYYRHSIQIRSVRVCEWFLNIFFLLFFSQSSRFILVATVYVTINSFSILLLLFNTACIIYKFFILSFVG